MPKNSANSSTSKYIKPQLHFSAPTNFYSAKIIYIKGRQHPVTIYHSAESQIDYVDAAMRTFFQVHLDQSPGDVLIFLPGQSPPPLSSTRNHFVQQVKRTSNLSRSL